MLLNIPDSAKVVAFKPEHPGLWAIKVGTPGIQQRSQGSVGCGVGISGVQGQEQRRVWGLKGRQSGEQAGHAGVRRELQEKLSEGEQVSLLLCLLDTLPMCPQRRESIYFRSGSLPAAGSGIWAGVGALTPDALVTWVGTCTRYTAVAATQ